MADVDALAAALEEIRHDLGLASHMTAIHIGRQGERLLAAVDAALEVHALTALHRHTEPCPRHYASMFGRRECPDCKVIEWTGCETCRDEYGNPARPEDCTTRQAITRALLGEKRTPDGL